MYPVRADGWLFMLGEEAEILQPISLRKDICEDWPFTTGFTGCRFRPIPR
jgi:hypothetical protein